jgi:hypothetical protein
VTIAALALALAVQAAARQPQVLAVEAFYAHIIEHHPLGLPQGEVKRTLWPLLSKRLARRLDVLQACEDDYFRRNRQVLEAEQLKPGIGWLEYGLFSGGNESALPAEVEVTRVEPAGAGRSRVHLRFTYRETFETYGRPPNPDNVHRWTGIAVVVTEAGRSAIDDYIPIDHRSGKVLTSLSEDFPECRSGRWTGPRY